jgi:RNA polymerase sigma-70 factor (ECF subfamily)
MGSSVSRPVLLHVPAAPSDADLVARAVAGDRWAREVLYRRHAGYLLGMTARLLASRGDAEEVVQDAFVLGFEQLGALRDPGAVRGWLAQIAVSLVRRRMRRGRLLRLLGLDRGADDATLESLAAPGVDAEGRSELALFDRVLGRMRAELRIAWVLRRVDGLELTEVASLAGCSLATAKRRIAEAETLIQRHVGRAEGAS